MALIHMISDSNVTRRALFYPPNGQQKREYQSDYLPSRFRPEDDASTRSAYKILKPIAILGKYLGIVPLIDLYENATKSPTDPSRCRRVFLDLALPITALALQVFAGANIARVLVLFMVDGTKRGIDLLTIALVNVTTITHSPICAILLYFSGNKIAAYIRQFDRVEVLLNTRLKRSTVFSYAFTITFGICMIVKTACWIAMLGLSLNELGADIRSWYPPVLFEMAVGCFFIALIVMTVSESQPEFMFIVFAYLLKQGFDALVAEIRKNATITESDSSYSSAVPEVDKIRRYRQLHQQLCDLAVTLNSLMSPTILMSFLCNIITGIVAIFLMLYEMSGTSDMGVAFAIIVRAAVPFAMIAAICGCADATTSSASAVIPSLFASMKLDTFEAREEAKLFAMKVHSNRLRFSASGFFLINRSILSTIVGAMATYVVVMMQFQMEDTEEEMMTEEHP